MANKTSIWSLPFVALMGANFFQSVSAFAAHATLPVYASMLGASTSMVGVVSGSFAFSALLVRPFAGPAFDSFSRKRLLIVSLAIVAIAFALISCIDNLALLVLARLFQGIGIGCAGPLAMSLVSEYLPPGKFSSGISIFALSQSLAQAIGPAVGLPLAEALGFQIVYLMSAGLLVLGIVSVLFITEPYHERLAYKLSLDRVLVRESLPAALALMLLATSFTCTTAYVVLYGYERGVGNLGLYFTIYALCLVLTRPLYGRLSDSYGPARLLVAGVAFFAASYIALHFASSFGGFALAAVLGSAGYGACTPLLQSIAISSAPQERRGSASNTAYIGLDIGTVAGPVIGGAVVEWFMEVTGNQAMAYSDMWLVMLIPIAGAFVIILSWNMRKRLG